MTELPVAEAPSPAHAQELAEAEYVALLEMLAGLSEDQWSTPTECAPWTVRDMVAHVAGASEEAVRLRVQLRHLRKAKKQLGRIELVDSLNAQQIADRAGRTPADLLAELRILSTRAPRARRRTPRFIRRRPLPAEAGSIPHDPIAHLIDVIYTRDIWMHRIDIARATGCPAPVSSAESDIVGLVVRDLDRGWSGRPFQLSMTGRVGGHWWIGGHTAGAPTITVDCVAACRMWSGRSNETALIPDSALMRDFLATRVLF